MLYFGIVLFYKEEEHEMDKKIIIIIISLAFITVASLGVTAWAIWWREPDVVLTPDYAPEDEEKNQTTIEGEGENKLEAPDGGGAVGLIYSKQVTVSLEEKKAVLMFGNPSRSSQDMVVQLMIRDEIIVQSGRITPGNKVTSLKLLNGAEKKLAAGGYEGKFVVLYYNRETGEKAILKTEIPIVITVK